MDHGKRAGSGIAESRWQSLYKLGGVAALVIALLLIGEIAVYATLPRFNSVVEHFAFFRDNWLGGLLSLDLLGMVAYLLFIPMILALYLTLRRATAALAAVATVFFFVGIADFFATNTAFSMLSLSSQYAAAQTGAERSLLLAAGQTMLTLFNENAFLVSYVIVSASWTLISTAMLRAGSFGRIGPCAGILAGASGIVAVVLEHITASNTVLTFAIAMYFAAIVFLFAWVIPTGLRLFRFGAGSAPRPVR